LRVSIYLYIYIDKYDMYDYVYIYSLYIEVISIYI